MSLLWKPLDVLTIHKNPYKALEEQRSTDPTTRATLALIGSTHKFKCAGWGRTTRRGCGQTIGVDKWNAMTLVASNMAKSEPSSDLLAMLKEMAEYALCGQSDHFSEQADFYIHVWKDDIRIFLEQRASENSSMFKAATKLSPKAEKTVTQASDPWKLESNVDSGSQLAVSRKATNGPSEMLITMLESQLQQLTIHNEQQLPSPPITPLKKPLKQTRNGNDLDTTLTDLVQAIIDYGEMPQFVLVVKSLQSHVATSSTCENDDGEDEAGNGDEEEYGRADDLAVHEERGEGEGDDDHEDDNDEEEDEEDDSTCSICAMTLRLEIPDIERCRNPRCAGQFHHHCLRITHEGQASRGRRTKCPCW